jgi:peptide/nickel transport system substrate-binding protein
VNKTLLCLAFFIITGTLLAGLAGCSSNTSTAATSSSAPATKTSTSAATTTAATSSAATTTTVIKPTTTTPAVETGGTLNFIYQYAMDAFGYPIEYRGQVGVYGYPCFEALWRVDANGVPSPSLATSWDATPNWSSVTFHLRKGVKFHDGTDWNATAAKYTLDKVKERKDTGTDVWNSIEVIDDYTLRMSFSMLQATQITILGQVLFASPTAIEKNGLEWARYNPVGTGPFKFSSYKRDISVDYVRNDAYWGDKPYLDGIHFIFIKDVTTAASALQAGDGHLMFSSAADPIVHSDLKNKGFQVYVVNQALNGLVPDSRFASSPFNNKNVRLAIEYAIDKETLCKSLGQGFWEPVYQYSRPDWYGYNKDLPKRTYDVAKAKQLLSDAGYPNGFKTKLNFGTANAPYLAALQDYLKKVGIMAEINVVGSAKMAEMLQKTGWDGEGFFIMAAGCWGNSSLWSLNFLFGTTWDQLSVQRPDGFFDQLKKTQSAEDVKTREENLRQLLKLVYDEAMVFPFYSTGPTFAEKKGVNGIDHFTSAVKFWWDPGKVWISKSAR